MSTAEQSARWRAKNPERAKELNRKHYQDRHARIRERQVWARMESRYGLTKEEYEALLEAQSGVCAICGQSCRTGERLSVDHNHATGEVRGLLCRACNFRLGQIEKPGLDDFLRYLDR